MSTATLSRLTFGGILRSEGIKLRTLRSTIWCYAILVIVNVGLGALISVVLGDPGHLSHSAQQSFAIQVSTLALNFSQLIIAVLGALVITGEYGTGMIRTTFTAAPGRLSALFGKALVFGVVTFVVSAISLILTAVITAPILGGSNVSVDFGDGRYWIALLGGAAYLTLVGLFAFALGAIIRNSAGGIAAALGAVLVLPTIVSIFAGITNSVVARNIGVFLPSNAGGRMYSYAAKAIGSTDPLVLEPWQGGLVLLAWVVVLLAIAATLIKRRDV